jgi:hypothetical protein
VIWPAETALALNQKAREEGARRAWTDEERRVGVRRLERTLASEEETIAASGCAAQ